MPGLFRAHTSYRSTPQSNASAVSSAHLSGELADEVRSRRQRLSSASQRWIFSTWYWPPPSWPLNGYTSIDFSPA